MTSHCYCVRVLVGLALVLFCSAAAHAGPVREFETTFRDAYADYRAALFATNSNDRAAASAALAAFDAKWSAMAGRWGSAPPPQYEDDASWRPMLERVRAILGDAREAIAAGRLQQAHETLEHFRDEIGSLHARNGIATYSDHMNAYHETMERVLGGDYGDFDAVGRRRLDGDLAVLAYLAANLERFRPMESADTAEFKALLASLQRSVGAAREAVASGDTGLMKQALAGLKPAYSKFFLRFG